MGGGAPCIIVAEAGINHNGDLSSALRLVRAAKQAGADLIKWQKRTPDLCVPDAQKAALKDTPQWGRISYLDYKRNMEFGKKEYDAIDAECRHLGIPWFASPWDLPSLEFLLAYDPPCLKVASACLTDLELLAACRRSRRSVVLSTGMSTEAEVMWATAILGPDRLVVLHCVSTYPCPTHELNLSGIGWLQARFPVVGYSSHHPGVWDGLCAAVLGAAMVEKHFTLDRTLWGTDHAASLEPAGLAKMVRYIRNWEQARGDGQKRVWDSERPVMARLRRVP